MLTWKIYRKIQTRRSINVDELLKREIREEKVVFQTFPEVNDVRAKVTKTYPPREGKGAVKGKAKRNGKNPTADRLIKI